MGRWIAFFYGVASYLVFLIAFLYAVGFVGNIFVPKGIDSGLEEPVTKALLINMLLLGLFAIQHSVMARRGFKDWWTKLIPEPVERSTFVLFTSLILILLYWQWRPMTGNIWTVENPAGHLILEILFWLGWVIVLVSTFMINHFDLFGLRQVYLYIKRKEYTPPDFHIPGFYKYLRHPVMLGFIIAFWATPEMTVGHLLFAIATTAYIFIGILLEERDLIHLYGEVYILFA